MGVQVEVGELTADWAHLHPRFTLDDVAVFDSKHQLAVQHLLDLPRYGGRGED